MKALISIAFETDMDSYYYLNSLLQHHCPNVQLVGQFSDLEKYCHLVNLIDPDLIFLNIGMALRMKPDKLKKLDDFMPRTIFMSKTENDFLPLESNAIDCIYNPINPTQLIKAIKKASLTSNKTPTLEKNLSSVERVNPTKLAIHYMGGISILSLDQIMHIKGSGNYSIFLLGDGTNITSSKPLKFYDELLSSNCFFRCHHSHIVNINFIEKILTAEGNQIKLTNGEKIPLVNKRKKNLLDSLNSTILGL